MTTLRISIVLLITMVMMCAGTLEDVQISNRPTRPEVFKNVDEVKDYVARMKAYIATSNRFGKRFAPMLMQQQERQPEAPRPWRSIYDILENYEAM